LPLVAERRGLSDQRRRSGAPTCTLLIVAFEGVRKGGTTAGDAAIAGARGGAKRRAESEPERSDGLHKKIRASRGRANLARLREFSPAPP